MASIATRPVNKHDYEYQWLVKRRGESTYELSPYRVTELEVMDYYRSPSFTHFERLEITKREPKTKVVLLYANSL